MFIIIQSKLLICRQVAGITVVAKIRRRTDASFSQPTKYLQSLLAAPKSAICLQASVCGGPCLQYRRS